jgi:hypothetical protein
MSEARYAVGIDLGTTHCVMAAVDLTASDRDGWWTDRSHSAVDRARRGRGAADAAVVSVPAASR